MITEADNQFPRLDIAATLKRPVTQRELGNIIGEHFRLDAQEEIRIRRTRLGPRKYDELLENCKQYEVQTKRAGFSPILEEISGFAQGADISFLEAFFLSCHELYDPSELEPTEHCTTIAVRQGRGIILAHNEEWPSRKDENNRLYILNAIIEDSPGTPYGLLGLCYSLERPGTGVDINTHGVAQAVNSIDTNTIPSGVPRTILARATTRCSTTDDVIKLVSNTKRASGYNLIVAQNQLLRNIEIAGPQVSVEKAFTRLGALLWAHTNGFLDPEMKSHARPESENSRARYEQVTGLMELPMTLEKIIAILSDQTDPHFPIFSLDTQATCLIDTAARTLRIRRNQPQIGEFVEYHLPSL